MSDEIDHYCEALDNEQEPEDEEVCEECGETDINCQCFFCDDDE
jgi:hypothetical protein